MVKMKNTLEEINRLADSKEWVSNLEYRVMESTQDEHQKEKRLFKNEDRLREPLDNIKQTNIHIRESHKKKRKG